MLRQAARLASLVFFPFAAVALEPGPGNDAGPGLEEWRVALSLGETSIVPVPAAPKPGRVLFVAPDGNDRHRGTASAPLASLRGARDAIRALRTRGGLPRGGVAVVFRPGVYVMRESCDFSAEDSGEPGAPVTYRAERPGTVVFSGGLRLTNFQPVTNEVILRRLPPESRGRVWQTDLRAQGVRDFGTLQVRGFAQPDSPPTMELFCDGRPMQPARWPNDGFVRIARLIEPGALAPPRPTVFELDSDRLARWSTATDAWLYGYFRYQWADSTLPVARFDAAARTITTAEPYHYGSDPGADNREGIRLFVFNLLEEIDAPGEWYLDRTTGLLYFYPPADPRQGVIEVSVLGAPMVAGRGLAHVRFENLVFDLGRASGIELRDAEHCVLAGCTVRRFAGNGITLTGSHDNLVHSCDVHTLGRRGIELIGGDRATLTPARHAVENCDIHDFGRLDRTYTPAIQLEGVGNRVAHNRLHDCPSSVMRIEGNDHLIEANEVYEAVRESEDQGAMELYGNPTYRGVVFRQNVFRDIGPPADARHLFSGRAALRFDDLIGGMLVTGNVFCRASSGGFGAIQINSGHDNVIDHNLFIACGELVTGGWEAGNALWATLRAGPLPKGFFLTAPYRQHYPSLARLLRQPGINVVTRNLAWECAGVWETADPTRRLAGPAPVWRRPDRWRQWSNGVADASVAPQATLHARGAPIPLEPAQLEAWGFAPATLSDAGLYVNEYRPVIANHERSRAK